MKKSLQNYSSPVAETYFCCAGAIICDSMVESATISDFSEETFNWD